MGTHPKPIVLTVVACSVLIGFTKGGAVALPGDQHIRGHADSPGTLSGDTNCPAASSDRAEGLCLQLSRRPKGSALPGSQATIMPTLYSLRMGALDTSSPGQMKTESLSGEQGSAPRKEPLWGSVEAEAAMGTVSGTLWATLAALSGLLFWRLARLGTAATLSLYGILLPATVLGSTA